jgi:hypothetical protein
VAPAASPSPWPAGGPGRTRGGPASGRRTAPSATPRPSPAQKGTTILITWLCKPFDGCLIKF